MYLGVSDCGLRFVCLRLPAPVVKQVCGCVGISELLPRLEPLDRDIVDGGHDGRHLEVDAARGVGLIGDEEASRRLCMCFCLFLMIGISEGRLFRALRAASKCGLLRLIAAYCGPARARGGAADTRAC